MAVKRLSSLILSVILVFTCGCMSIRGTEIQPENTEGNSEIQQPTSAGNGSVPINETFVPDIELGTISDATHPALMQCDKNDNFYPDSEVSRGELCIELAGVLTGLPSGNPDSYVDISSDDEEYAAVCALYSCGLLPWDINEPLQKGLAVTFDEISLILQSVAYNLTGDDSLRVLTLSTEFSGSDLLTRAQLAYILITVAGRQPSEAGLLCGGYLPADVLPDRQYWAYIADAVIDKEPDIPEDGVYRAYGSLYGVWQHGELIKDLDYGIWSFDSNGRYTTGNSELDAYLYDALVACGAADLPTNEALEAAYLYVKYNFDYIVTPADMETVDTGVTGWEYERALRFFQYGGGTCYGYAAVFGLMARMLGENAYIVSARINQYDWPHGFVVIPEDGIDWIYDPELESTRQDRHEDLELFHIQNYTIYNYWYETDW